MDMDTLVLLLAVVGGPVAAGALLNLTRRALAWLFEPRQVRRVRRRGRPVPTGWLRVYGEGGLPEMRGSVWMRTRTLAEAPDVDARRRRISQEIAAALED